MGVQDPDERVLIMMTLAQFDLVQPFKRIYGQRLVSRVKAAHSKDNQT
jgi:hypothetical protein